MSDVPQGVNPSILVFQNEVTSALVPTPAPAAMILFTPAAGASDGGGVSIWGSITGTLSDQTDLNSALNAKAPLASPTFTGVPAAPTAAGATSTTQVATTAFVGGEVTAHAAAADPHGDRSFATSEVGTHAALTTDSHPASAITNVPAGTIAATDVQSAINELDTEKLSAASASEQLTGTSTTVGLTPASNKGAVQFYADKSGDYTLLASDENIDLRFTNGSAAVLTLPLSPSPAFTDRAKFPGKRAGAGTLTIDAAVGVTLNGVSGGSCTVQTRYQGYLLENVGLNAFEIAGDLSAVT